MEAQVRAELPLQHAEAKGNNPGIVCISNKYGFVFIARDKDLVCFPVSYLENLADYECIDDFKDAEGCYPIAFGSDISALIISPSQSFLAVIAGSQLIVFHVPTMIAKKTSAEIMKHSLTEYAGSPLVACWSEPSDISDRGQQSGDSIVVELLAVLVRKTGAIYVYSPVTVTAGPVAIVAAGTGSRGGGADRKNKEYSAVTWSKISKGEAPWSHIIAARGNAIDIVDVSDISQVCDTGKHSAVSVNAKVVKSVSGDELSALKGDDEEGDIAIVHLHSLDQHKTGADCVVVGYVKADDGQEGKSGDGDGDDEGCETSVNIGAIAGLHSESELEITPSLPAGSFTKTCSARDIQVWTQYFDCW
jgi:hypothetical protein